MKERPILFSAPMIRAILAGGKSQTRRIVKGVDPDSYPYCGSFDDRDGLPSMTFYDAPGDKVIDRIEAKCTYGNPGDRLWVREMLRKDGGGGWYYAGDQSIVMVSESDKSAMRAWAHHKPGYHCVSIHMPRLASRITLEITDVRVERLTDITIDDAVAEGIPPYEPPPSLHPGDPRHNFGNLWDSLHGTKHPWGSNPWVWALSFKRIDL